jgi:prepilin peptidase CpaA
VFAGTALGFIGGCVFTFLLLYACVSDLRTRRIPNKLVLVIAASGVIFSLAAVPALGSLGRSVGGLLVGFAIWFPFYLLRLLGAGDVKLFAAVGAWLGPALTLKAALLAAVAGGVLSIVFLVAGGALVSTLAGLAAWTATLRRNRWVHPIALSQVKTQLPYGVALSVGAALAAWFPTLIF